MTASEQADEAITAALTLTDVIEPWEASALALAAVLPDGRTVAQALDDGEVAERVIPLLVDGLVKMGVPVEELIGMVAYESDAAAALLGRLAPGPTGTDT